MHTFPFSDLEWSKVQEISHALVNATLANDSMLQAPLYAELLSILEKLRLRYGDHPILLETAADFSDDPAQRLDLYRSAIRLAETNKQPTFTIRISLASMLTRDFHDNKQAARELFACESEVISNADESQRCEWFELMKECKGMSARK